MHMSLPDCLYKVTKHAAENHQYLTQSWLSHPSAILLNCKMGQQHVHVVEAQVTVEDAILRLSCIATQPLKVEVPQFGSTWMASEVALDALHLLCRDDSSDFRILTHRNIAFLTSELKAFEQSASADTHKMIFQRCGQFLLTLLHKRAFHCSSTQLPL